MVRATRAAESFGDECVEIVLLHVNGTEFPQFDRPEGEAWERKELLIPMQLCRLGSITIFHAGRPGLFRRKRVGFWLRQVRIGLSELT